MADTPVAPTPIGAWPTAPQRTDEPATFVTRADAWVAATPTRSTEMNATATNVNYNAESAFDSAAEAVVSAANALASANGAAASEAATETTALALAGFAGAWSSLTGAKTVPLSVDHDGAIWILLENTADVTLDEPGVSSKWALAYGVARYDRSTNILLIGEDTGKIINITSGTFSQTFSACATLGATWNLTYINAGSGVITLDPNSSETINGAATLALTSGMVATITCDGSNLSAIVTSLHPGVHEVVVHTGNGHGSTNNKIRRFTTAMTNTGTAITYADSAANGGSFTIALAGTYAIQYSDSRGSTAPVYMGITINSAALTTSVESTPVATRAAICRVGSASQDQIGQVARTVFLNTGDVVRAHTDGTLTSTADTTLFSIRRIGA